MSPKKNYSRYFIILQEEEKGYAQDNDKTPSGYVKLEKKNEKCKVSYYVQNLNSKMQPYYMALICYKKDVKKVISLGKVIIDNYGRVDHTNEYDFDDIAKTALSMDKIAGAALVKIVDKNIISLMSGFISSEVPTGWKNFDLISDKRDETNKEENIFDKYEDTIEGKKMTRTDEHSNTEIENEHKDENANNENEYNIKQNADEINEEHIDNIKNRLEIDNYKSEEKMRKNDDIKNIEVTNTDTESNPDVDENDQKVNENDQKVNKREKVINKSDNTVEDLNKENEEIEQIEEIEEIQQIQQNKTSEIKINYDSKCRKCDKQNQNDYDEEYSDMERNEEDYPMGLMGDFFKTLVKGYKSPKDMGNNIKQCNWYKISIEDIESMYDMSDYDKYTVMYYPMLCYYSYIRKYEHYCLGYKCDNQGRLNYLVYAIPGTKSKMDQPYGGKTGFVTWIPCKDKKDMGYWIMFYDIKNSTVVIPKKKK